MAVSVPGLLTLLGLVLVGPLVFAALSLLRRLKSRQHKEKNAEAQESAAVDNVNHVEESTNPGDSSGSTEAVAPACPEEKREEFKSVDYMLSLLGYAIGIGNLWRFPYLVGKWGGSAFVFAYLVCLLLVATPLYLMEMGIGQYARKSTIDCFRMINQRWVGLAIGQAVMLFIILGYYNVLLAYCLIYISGSLFDPLPWSSESIASSRGAAEAFWQKEVLHQYVDVHEADGLGALQPRIVLALLVVWVIIFLSIAFGKRILSKVVWVTVLGPIILMLVMLVRALQLDGSEAGVAFYVGKFDKELLLDLNMWAAACGQILFSLSPGMGTAITLSSYTKPKENVFRVCMIVAFSNSAFSLVGGFAIFGVLGNLAFRTGQTVAEVSRSGGTGLAFVAIAEGIQTFGSGTNVMAVLFFVMLLSLGLDSSYAWFETFVSYVQDYGKARGASWKRWKIVLGLSVLFFLLGLIYCTRMGNELLDVVDHFCVSYYLLLGCFIEVIMFHLDFGWFRFVQSIQQATEGGPSTPSGQKISIFWRVCLLVTAPLLTLFLFIQQVVSDVAKPYGDYPASLQVIGWTVFAITALPTFATLWRRGESSLPPLAKTADPPHEDLEKTVGGDLQAK